MKFRWKIFYLCIAIYLITLTITGIIITENNYYNTLNKEVSRSLKEQNNIYSNTILYLTVSQQQNNEYVSINNYGQRIVDMFQDEDSFVEIFDSTQKLVAPRSEKFDIERKDELESALSGKRNYILRFINNKHYLFINQGMTLNGQSLVLTYIKDITEIDNQRIEGYKFFCEIGIIGLIFIAVITGIISKIMMKPIEDLSKASINIASGNYKDRVTVKGKGEIATLAVQFNIMAEQVEEKVTELERESEKRQKFIDNLTHELRTPLTSIIGYAELFMKIKYNQDTFNKGLGYIYSEGNRMLKLINTLMKMIIAREDPFEIKNHSVIKVLNEVKDIIRIKAQNKNIDIKIEGEDMELSFDKDMLISVLVNLVDNSIKASNFGSTIVIGVNNNKKYIFVKDYGKGIEKKEIDRILDPFYRVDKSRSRKEGGVGLGLALCNEIIKKHNAKLEIESEVNKGTIVKIIF